MLQLTDANYYTPEANRAYMSCSQFKAFARCEAAALAELNGEWERPKSSALLVGSYVDAYISRELGQFRARTPELFKKDGTLKAEFQQAHTLAQRLMRDDLARMLLSGSHQCIKTGQIGGVWFKAKYDSLLEEPQVDAICKRFPEIRKLVPFGGPLIVDLKCMRDFEPIWNEHAQEKLSFIEHWGYDIQGAIYQKLDDRMAPFVIMAITKEAEPNLEAFHIPDEDLAFQLDEVEAKAPKFDAIKRGEIAPERCEQCAYCKATKRLNNVTHFRF